MKCTHQLQQAEELDAALGGHRIALKRAVLQSVQGTLDGSHICEPDLHGVRVHVFMHAHTTKIYISQSMSPSCVSALSVLCRAAECPGHTRW